MVITTITVITITTIATVFSINATIAIAIATLTDTATIAIDTANSSCHFLFHYPYVTPIMYPTFYLFQAAFYITGGCHVNYSPTSQIPLNAHMNSCQCSLIKGPVTVDLEVPLVVEYSPYYSP